MKLLGIIIFILIAAIGVIAGTAEGDPNYGKAPGFMLAVGLSGILIFLYFLIYGIFRKDKYILGAWLFIGISLGIFLLMTLSDTNLFGMFWGGLMIIGIFSVALFLFCAARIVYIEIKSEQ